MMQTTQKILLLALFAIGGGTSMKSALAAPRRASGAQTKRAKANEKTPAVGGELRLINAKDEALFSALRHTDVKAQISGGIVLVTVEQQFSNPSKVPVEAVYTFPLPDDAAVNAMEFRVGNRRIVGEIKRREEARQIYDQAKSEGKRTALLDQERPNVFTQSVANVMPGDDLRVRISFVQRLKYKGGAYEWAFPTVVGPRYAASGGYAQTGQRGVGVAANVTPPIAPPPTRSGHDLSLSVGIDAGVPITSIRSELHPIDVRKNGARATVKLKDENTLPNRDFILRYAVAGGEIQSGVLLQRDGKGGYFSLVMQPPARPKSDQISPRELVFVVDQTGSQGGWPIEKAKETMRYALDKLRAGDTFQVLGFNTGVYPCFDKPVKPTAANLKKARAFINGLQAQGGTDILQALQAALKIPLDRDRLRVVVYLTDGFVNNDMTVVDYLRKNRGTTRVFTFGMGNSVNRFLLDNMAREGRGEAEYVTVDPQGTRPDNADEAQDAVARFYQKIATPVLIDPQVDWGNLPVTDMQPQIIPDVFENGPVVVTGRFSKPAKGTVMLRGWAGGKRVTQRVAVDFGAAKADNPALEALWAREKIEQLQAQDYQGAQNNNPDAKIKEQIVQTALDHHLMSQWTSFVAVEQRVVNPGGQNAKNDVPVEVPDGVDYEKATGLSAPPTNPSLRYGLSSNGSRFAARPGDPLIRIFAPQTARRVVAILPDGQILPLTWNIQTKAWEARFDVPGYVADGAYRVAVLIENGEGKRSRFELIYQVDTKSPSGDAGIQVIGGRVQLQLAAGADVQRVTAITPWNQRVELKRGTLASAWSGAVEVPQNWQGTAAQVRFVLTDAAHNRTTIEVDWSR